MILYEMKLVDKTLTKSNNRLNLVVFKRNYYGNYQILPIRKAR